MTSQTAVVLGCKGQDGSLMCKSLLDKNYKVIGLIRGELKNHSNLHRLGIEKDIEVKIGDIRNFNDIHRLLENNRPKCVYNLAAQSSVGKSFINPNESIETIVNGTMNILNVAKTLDYSGQLFFAGSSEMFGNTEGGANSEHVQNPVSPYAIGKQASFNLVKLYRERFNLKCVTGILFNHESNLRDKNFVTQKIVQGAIGIANKKQTNKIKLGNINVIRDWGWAPEYIEAMQLVANSKQLTDHVICTGKPNSLKSFINKLFTFLNLDWHDYIEIDPALYRPNEIEISYGNPLPIFENLGWKAKEDIDSIIEKLIISTDINN